MNKQDFIDFWFNLADARLEDFGYIHFNSHDDAKQKFLQDLNDVIAQEIADHEQKQWLPYPENEPEKDDEYWIRLINGNEEICEYRLSNLHIPGWIGRFGVDVIAFRPLPEAWKGCGE